ncbi:MAG: 23S rRNA (guanosine(2251)-2'-O)-methyltransferase RlmB [Clostridiales bacterium]|jgi:23S rRNA (guanosine2251-2'-O)-methyltransferase|nr:23S rRNA (guanosine(2251)-2'-O)-methyltransferase RlmB [Clostridiales bacterium]
MSEYIVGRNSVLEALKAGRALNRVLLAEGIDQAFSRQVTALCREKQVPFVFLDKSKLSRLAGENHGGVAADTAATAYVELEDLLEAAAKKEHPPLLLILDGLEDPHNLGAVMRSALCAGADGIIIPKRRAVPLNQTVAKVAAGAAEHLPVARVANLVQTARRLKKEGFWLAAADMDGKPCWQTDLTGPLVLVLGGEGHGISPLLKKECDLVVGIPIMGPISSLNVSAAAAVLLFEVVRQKQNP